MFELIIGLWLVLLVLAICLSPTAALVVVIRKLNAKSDASSAKVWKIIIAVFCLMFYQIGLVAFLIVHMMDNKKKPNSANQTGGTSESSDSSESERVIMPTPPRRMTLAEREYYDSLYYRITQKPYWNVEDDKGAYGEYLIWKELRFVGSYYENCESVKFLFNAYIPKGDGTTSEVDVIMLCPQGVFVFESKNYSGWIFGNEFGEQWTQTLVGGGECTKNHFYNPIGQNKKHIEVLKSFLNKDMPIWNIVVFSERCELKAVEVHTQNIFTIQRDQLQTLVYLLLSNRAAVLSDEEIEAIYQSLYPFTQVSDDVKAQHIEDANWDS